MLYKMPQDYSIMSRVTIPNYFAVLSTCMIMMDNIMQEHYLMALLSGFPFILFLGFGT